MNDEAVGGVDDGVVDGVVVEVVVSYERSGVEFGVGFETIVLSLDDIPHLPWFVVGTSLFRRVGLSS